MEKRKGIRSLIPTGMLTTSWKEIVQEVPVGRIAPSPYQPRRQAADEGIAELVDSIKTHGILQPLVARRQGEMFELIAGERRLQAAKQAGLSQVPVILRDASDREMLELGLVENLQREDISPMDAAEAYWRLMEEFELNQEQVAERVGKSRSKVANSLRLLNLPQPIQESLRRGEIDEGHGKVLAGIEDEKLALRIWKRVASKGLSVKEATALAVKLTGRNVPRGTILGQPKFSELDPNLLDLQNRMMTKLSTKVRLRPKGGGGTIEIDYFDEQELDRIFCDIVG